MTDFCPTGSFSGPHSGPRVRAGMAEGAETGVEMRNREEDLDDEMGDLVDESGDEVYGLLHSLLSTNSHLGRVFFCLSRCDFATGREKHEKKR